MTVSFQGPVCKKCAFFPTFLPAKYTWQSNTVATSKNRTHSYQCEYVTTRESFTNMYYSQIQQWSGPGLKRRQQSVLLNWNQWTTLYTCYSCNIRYAFCVILVQLKNVNFFAITKIRPSEYAIESMHIRADLWIVFFNFHVELWIHNFSKAKLT